MAELDEEMSSLARLRHDIAEMLDGLPTPTTGAGWRCSSELMQISSGPRSRTGTNHTHEETP